MRTSPLMPWAAPMRPISNLLDEVSPILLRRRSGCGFGGSLGLRLGALGRLLARLGALGVVAGLALEESRLVEEAKHPIGRLRADAEPMLDALGDKGHALAVIGEL